MTPRRPRPWFSLAFAGVVVVAVGAGVAWRLWFDGRVTLEGPLRPGSLRCDDECHFELVLEARGGTLVRVASCIMPDALRDWPGHSVQLMVAGRWQGPGELAATALLVRDGSWAGPKPSNGRPAACFVPPPQR